MKVTVRNNFWILFSGKPLPIVTWYRNDIIVSNVSVVIPNTGTTHVRSELRISGLGRRDVHSELTCRATNNPKTPPLASTLHVDMNCKTPLHTLIVLKTILHSMLWWASTSTISYTNKNPKSFFDFKLYQFCKTVFFSYIYKHKVRSNQKVRLKTGKTF